MATDPTFLSAIFSSYFHSYSPSLYALPPFIAAMTMLLLGIAVVLRERLSSVSVSFLTMALTMSLWLFGYTGVYSTHDPGVALAWAKLAYVGVSLIPPAVYAFAVSVLGLSASRRIAVRLAWGLGVSFATVIVATPALFAEMYSYWWGFYPHYRPLFSIPFLGFFFSLMIASLFEYGRELRLVTPGTIHAQRIRGLTIGTAIAYGGCVDFLAKYGIAVYPFGYAPILVFALVSAATIWRYRLIDITPQFAAPEIIRTMTDGLIVFDREGIVRFVNPATCELFGVEEEDWIGLSIRTIAGEFGGEPLAALERLGTLSNHEVRYPRRSGDTGTLSLSASKMLDQRGQAVASVCLLRDITAQRRIQDELAAAKEAAEAANRAKSNFLANMSHEIRTPMNGVIGMTDLLLGTPLSPEQNEYADTVRLSAEHLLSLINDILDFSKIEAGKLTLEPIPFDLRSAVEETVELLAARAVEKNVELISFYAPDAPPRIVGDPARLRQVLTNLLGNALKFTPHGHVLASVKCLERDATTATLRIAVEDTGIGIPEAELERIFDKFTQADASTTRRYGGTGLGLSICRELVSLMDGRIEVASRLGTGSTFSVTLRFPIDNETVVEPLPVADLRGVRVLIIDDNAVNRRMLQEQVSSRGMRATAVASAEEALRELYESHNACNPYELAIVDYQMPAMDGEELGRAIKSSPLLQDTVLVMLTSVGQYGDGPRMLEAGFSGYLVKPVRQTQLFEALSTAWAVHQHGSGPALVTRHTLAEAGRAAANAAAALPEPSGRRVLLAEDNPLNQKVALRMLERFGCRATLATNGKEAVQMLEVFPYDLVLMDCEMPKMDGYEATAEVRRRENGSGRRVPIVAMTAHALSGVRERCLAAGMDDHLPKPVRLDKLHAILERWAPSGTGTESPAGDDVEATPCRLDRKILEDLRELERDGASGPFLSQMIRNFLETAPRSIERLRLAAAEGAADRVATLAHGLQGSSGALGARSMNALCARLQRAARSPALDDGARIIERLEAEFREVTPDLRRYLDEEPPAILQ